MKVTKSPLPFGVHRVPDSAALAESALAAPSGYIASCDIITPVGTNDRVTKVLTGKETVEELWGWWTGLSKGCVQSNIVITRAT